MHANTGDSPGAGKQCQRCKSTMTSGSAFCWRCGLPQQPPIGVPVTPSVAGYDRWRWSSWAIVVWTVAVICVFVLASSSVRCSSVFSYTCDTSGSTLALLALALYFWFTGMTTLSIIWYVTKPKE